MCKKHISRLRRNIQNAFHCLAERHRDNILEVGMPEGFLIQYQNLQFGGDVSCGKE